MYEDERPNDPNRDNYHRCPWCKKLYHHDECELDPIRGYVCPLKCVEPFNQPAYESPLNSE